MKLCKNKHQVVESDRFCTGCGSSVFIELKCWNCGYALFSCLEKFCGKCGVPTRIQNPNDASDNDETTIEKLGE